MDSNIDFRSLGPEAQEAIRLRAVDVVNSGMRKSVAAETFGISRRAISSWVRTNRQGGRESLKAKKRGRPQGSSRFNPSQCATVVNLIVDGRPDQLKLPFYLWTRPAVGQLIETRYGIVYSIYQVGRYLRKWGFTVRKPGNEQSFEQYPKELQIWLENEYPIIKMQAKAENAEIQWCNEVELQCDAAVAGRFSLKGQAPGVPRLVKNFGCSLIGSISNQRSWRFIVFTEPFTPEVMIDFLERLLKQLKRNIFLITNGHPVHRSVAVKKFLAEREGQIRLFELPGASSDETE